MVSKRGFAVLVRRPLAGLVIALMALVGLGRASRGLVFAAGEPQYVHVVTVDANGFARTDKAVEVGLNFTPLLQAQGGSGALDPNSIRVYEINGSGDVLDNDVPFQFDRAGDYNATSKAHGTLVFLMKGNTAANETRRYRVYFDVTGTGFSAPSFTDRVALTDGVAHKGYQSVRVVTGGAEYFYHKPGGGFATLVDANNNDWINWNTASGGAGDFRGIPNMVHPNDGGYFHPGRNTATTTVVGDGVLRASFVSNSKDGAWQVRWDIFPTYARLTVLKAPSNYWFLYEGVPGGSLQPSSDRMTRSNGNSIPASGTWDTDIAGDEWVFATDPNVGRSLYLAHTPEDTKIDGYYADGSNMTVFGFGRNANQRLLSGVGQQLTFGFVDATNVNGVEPVVNSAYKPLTITGSNDDGGGNPGPVCDSQPYTLYLSPKANKTIDGTVYADEDVARYDASTCELTNFFDGSAAGLPAAANIDALALKDGDIYISLLAPASVPGVAGTVDDSDVLVYHNGAFSLFLDGSAYGLTTNYEDVDALAFDETGALLVSTVGVSAVPGVAKGADEDLLRFDNGTWAVLFDGSTNGKLTKENLAGASMTGGNLYLSVVDAFSVPNVSGNGLDIFKCTPSSLGLQTTACTYSAFFDVGEHGLPAFDAIDVQLP